MTKGVGKTCNERKASLLSFSLVRREITINFAGLCLHRYRKIQEESKKTCKNDIQNQWLAIWKEEKNHFHSYKENEGQSYQEEQNKAKSIIQNYSELLIYYSAFATVRM